MDNPIPSTIADAPVAPHYSELFASVCETLGAIADIAQKRDHKRVLAAVTAVDHANRDAYAKMLATVTGDNGETITDADRVDFVRWLALESNKMLVMAALAQAMTGNPSDDNEHSF